MTENQSSQSRCLVQHRASSGILRCFAAKSCYTISQAALLIVLMLVLFCSSALVYVSCCYRRWVAMMLKIVLGRPFLFFERWAYC